MGVHRELMSLCRGPLDDVAALDAAVAAEQGLPLFNEYGESALHRLCANEDINGLALASVLLSGPAELALTPDRSGATPLDLLCRNEAATLDHVRAAIARCGPELVASRRGSELHVLSAAHNVTAEALRACVTAEPSSATLRAPAAGALGATPLRVLCENRGVRLKALEALLAATGRRGALLCDEAGASGLHFLCASEAVSPALVSAYLAAAPAAAKGRDEDGWSPLTYLCRNKRATAEVLRLVVAARPEAARETDAEGMAPLHHLCWNEGVDAAAGAELFRADPSVATVADGEGLTPARYLTLVPALCTLELLKVLAAEVVGDAKVDRRLAELADAADAAAVFALRETVARTAEAHAGAWRALAKKQLDRGEYAEALALFAEGAKACGGRNYGLAHRAATFDLFAREAPNEARVDLSAFAVAAALPPAAAPQNRRGDYGGDALNVYRGAVVDAAACRAVAAAAEKTATAAWLADRREKATDHAVFDLPATDLPEPERAWVANLVASLADAAKTLFPETLAAEPVRVLDAFVVRYDAQRCFGEMRPHVDESLVSLSVALNDVENYEGGGLFVDAADPRVLTGPAGTVFCFPGAVTHGGHPVTKCTRTILSLFLVVDKNRSGLPRGYTMRRGD